MDKKFLIHIDKQKDFVFMNWQMQGMNYFTSTNTKGATDDSKKMEL